VGVAEGVEDGTLVGHNLHDTGQLSINACFLQNSPFIETALHVFCLSLKGNNPSVSAHGHFPLVSSHNVGVAEGAGLVVGKDVGVTSMHKSHDLGQFSI